MRPKRLKKLCVAYHAAGFSTGCVHIFLATELTPMSGRTLDASEFVEPIRIPFRKAFRMAQTNRIIDAQTLIGLLWTKRHLGQDAI
jgi:hypothetical protein